MNWDDFLNYELVRIGDVRLMSGKLFVVFLVATGTWLTLNLIRRPILNTKDDITEAQRSKRQTAFVIAKYIVWIISIIIMLEILGIPVTPLLVGSTALLVGIGLGLQRIARDFFSGLFLLFDSTIKVGDIIEVNNEVGKVVEMNLRSSEILTRDQVTIILPNSQFIEEKVINWTRDRQKVRFSVKVGVSYDADAEEVMALLKEAMIEQSSIHKKPEPFVWLTNFGDSAIEYELHFWSKYAFEIEKVKSDLRVAVYKKLKANNIKIPYPQRDLHITGMEQMIESKK